MISAIRLSIEAMDASAFSQKEQQVYQNVLTMTRQAYNDVRLLAHNLQPEELEKFGLVEALQRLMNKLNDSQLIRFSLLMNKLERLPKELEFNLYSICLELANNIVKHSGATEASFEFVPKSDQFQLLITDNGKGFIKNNTSDGMGMRTIQERTDQMGGVLKIHSRPGEGTLIQLTIPFTSPARA
jgi:signal transduction histidine kinase